MYIFIYIYIYRYMVSYMGYFSLIKGWGYVGEKGLEAKQERQLSAPHREPWLPGSSAIGA